MRGDGYTATIMKHITSLLVAVFASAAFAQAQNIILEDEFDDGIVGAQWTVSFDQLAFWTAGEYTDYFHYTNLTTPFGAFDERYTLTSDLAGGLQGTFQLDGEIEWNDQQGFSDGENAMVFVMRLVESSGVEIASFRIDDVSSRNSGDVTFSGGATAGLPGLANDSGCSFSLMRDANDAISYSIRMDGGASASGSLGTVVGDVDQVEFYVSHTAPGGPFGQTLGQMHVDSVRLWDAPRDTDVLLSNNALIAGLPATLEVSDATPGSQIFLGYSLAGAGPTQTAFGPALLSVPINNFAPVAADANGDAAIVINVPLGTSGTTVWFQALDQAAGELSNGIARTVF